MWDEAKYKDELATPYHARQEIHALRQRIAALESERDAARRAAAAFYRYIMAKAAESAHVNCSKCRPYNECEELVSLMVQSDNAFSVAMEAAKDFKL